MSRNVHKEDKTLITFPKDAIQEDRGLKTCGVPQLVLADPSDVISYKNDRTGIAYKFDTMTIELEDKNGVITLAPGIEVSFPNQPDAKGFVIDWRQVINGFGQLIQGCYKVRVNWTLSGSSDFFYYGSYNLLQYSIFNARKTARIYVVLNDLVRKQSINYRDSGFAGTVRFEGSFGYMQPNYDTENNTHTNRERFKIRNEAIRSYELRTSYLPRCQTRLIDEQTLLAANQIYITDHNANNHDQNIYDFPVILDEDESPSFEYTLGVYAKITAKFLDKIAFHESKYDGNISGSENIILELPTVVSSCSPCVVTLDSSPFLTVPSGTTTDAKLVDQDDATIVPLSIVGNIVKVDQSVTCKGTSGLNSTGEAGDPNGSFWTLPTGKVNLWNHNYRWAGITGGYTDGTNYFNVSGVITTRSLAFPEFLACDLLHVDCDNNFPMYAIDTWGGGYTNYSVADTYNNAFSTSSFASGFRTGTIIEIDNCVYYPAATPLLQKPFEAPQIQYWSETGDATNAYILNAQKWRILSSKSGASGQRFPVRTTNISEL